VLTNIAVSLVSLHHNFSRLPSGPNAEHQQLQIDIKDSPVRGSMGHVAHLRNALYKSTATTATTTTTTTTTSISVTISDATKN